MNAFQIYLFSEACHGIADRNFSGYSEGRTSFLVSRQSAICTKIKMTKKKINKIKLYKLIATSSLLQTST
jgi:hypothetical protein